MDTESRKEFPDRPWKIEEAAEYLQVSVRTVYNRMKDSGLPHRYIGRDLRFTRDDLDQWLSQQPGAAA